MLMKMPRRLVIRKIRRRFHASVSDHDSVGMASADSFEEALNAAIADLQSDRTAAIENP